MWSCPVLLYQTCRGTGDVGGARRTASEAGIGWFDETGAADFTLGPTFRIRISGTPPMHLDTNAGWRPATTAVCEALLAGTSATVAALHERTELAMSTVATALKFVVKVGSEWTSAGLRWSTAGTLTAEVLAPLLTQVSPMEIYLEAHTLAELRVAARTAGLEEANGGRLLLRPFPSPAGAALSNELQPGFWSVPWPRAFADLRSTGVRGEDAADHLREVCERV